METSAPFPEGTSGQQSTPILASLMELVADAILVLDSTGTILSWNQGAERLYGWTAQEAVGQFAHRLLQTHFPQPREEIEHSLAAGALWEGELVQTRKNGTQVIVESRQVLLRDTEHRPITLLEIDRDITEHKQIERQRIEADGQFLTEMSKVLSSSLDYQETLTNVAHLVVPHLADWFAVDLVDEQGHFTLIEVAHKDPEQARWARQLRERFPIDPAAPTGAPRVVRTGQAERYADIPDALLVATARNEEELALARQIGYSSVMLVPLVARGETIGVVTFVATESGKHYDERDLALAEEVGRRAGVALDNARLYREAQRSRDQIAIILQGVADGIIVYAPNSQILYANEAAAQMTGYTSVQEMLATPPLGITRQYTLIDEQGQPFSEDQLTHHRVLAGEQQAQAIIGYTRIGVAQPERWSLVTSRPVLTENEEVQMIVTITHDITERMIAERRKDEFMSMTSHELRTPVTSLKGFTYVLQRRLAKQGDEQGLHYLARMDAQLDKLTTLISDLLDIARMQTGKLTLRMQPCDLDALIEETIENVQAATTTHELRVEGRTNAWVLGDKERLGQVYINLLTNAIKYSPQATHVVVHLARDESAQQAIVSVQDFGIGIEPAKHERLFERFYQVTDPEEKTYPGLGIGLYIAREIVTRHVGRIGVESRKGAGATFSVALPLLPTEER